MIKATLLMEIKAYCEANGVNNIDVLVNKMLVRGFTIEKYGETPASANNKPEIVEVIKEVPVEIVKEVYITNDETIIELTKQIDQLNDELVEKGKSNLEAIMSLSEEMKKKDSRIQKLEEELNNIKHKKDLYNE